MKLVVLSDLHGTLPDIPEADIMLIGGDICPSSDPNRDVVWIKNYFKPWLNKLPVKAVIGVAGNHDAIFQRKKSLIPKLKWTYLEDRDCVVDGIKIFGSPWTSPFMNWYFMKNDRDLTAVWELIEPNTDVLLLHSPPYGCADLCRTKHGIYVNVGCTSLLKAIFEYKPRLVVFGHIHGGYGIYEADKNAEYGNIQFDKIETDTLKIPKQCDKIYFINASIMNEEYEFVNKPIIIEME